MDCDAQALRKGGKPLTGTAKFSFVKKTILSNHDCRRILRGVGTSRPDPQREPPLGVIPNCDQNADWFRPRVRRSFRKSVNDGFNLTITESLCFKG